ncbi:redoxin domain-containing protein [Actibacterium sp. XHP0104]|uniref:redoxin domain-containing protein n=1 Tax=Actibacterium sp. XHP0104 TaxID=2984335 RepID=UPI0021E76BE9|nr:redoxin domain-containing protein [Actibacterium sp. XHP0104]MCV2880960.1 redoxin domain-containing protein [Actibacterium sp. XHP0104]
MTATRPELPDWSVDQWFNTLGPLSLADLRGKVVVIEAFQMLCPGCVSHGLPLAQQVHDVFSKEDVAVIGLHTVFEHHAAMTPVSLQAFLHEYRITFPVGVDTPGKGDLPLTMERYGLRGTPSLLVVDRNGGLAAHHFGQVSALRLGAEIASVICEAPPQAASATGTGAAGCDEDGCVI